MPPAEFTYCPHCGKELQRASIEGRERPVCPACRYIQFLNPVVGVAAIIRDDAGRVLLCRKTRGGIWSFPSGYLEWGEEIRRGLARELLEELGVEIAVGDVFAVHSNFDNIEKQTVGVFFFATILRGEPAPSAPEINAARYFALDELPDFHYASDRAVAADLRR
jgi:ADP-ribose pyrophosphatase YjhB (NUDIX family)